MLLVCTNAACVTEVVVPTRGIEVKPAGARPSPNRPSDLQKEPVARPASGVTVSAAVSVSIVPLGTVVYDGQTLPLASPDGRYLAVQTGEAPTWPMILGEQGQEPATRTTINVFDASGSSLSLIHSPQSEGHGLMLGRNADAQGFLVESPQRDGARWIGRVEWSTGKVSWLVRDAAVNAHAVLLPGGGLAWTRRAVTDSAFELVVRSPGGEESVRSPGDGSYWFPLIAGKSGFLYVPRTHRGGTDLDVIRLVNGRPDVLFATRNLAATDDPLLAHQMSVTLAGPVAGREEGALVCLSPRHGRIGVFDDATGLFEPLAPGTIAAARSPDPRSPGYFCTTADAFVFVPKVGKGSPAGPAAVVLPGPFVARATWEAPPSLLLFGPVRGAPDRLDVVRLVLVGD
jgi:hypothetical protein